MGIHLSKGHFGAFRTRRSASSGGGRLRPFGGTTLSRIESNHGNAAVLTHIPRRGGLSAGSSAITTPYGGYFPLHTDASTRREAGRDLSGESAGRRRSCKYHSWWSGCIAFFLGRSFPALLRRLVRFDNALTWAVSNKTDRFGLYRKRHKSKC